MEEVRFHGRGGQGTVVAAVLMAKAFFRAGLWVQTFPLFGVERRGAPVEAYLRLDREKILIRCNIYTPDHVVVQDPKLLNTVDITAGLKPGGWVLLNAKRLPENLKPFFGFQLAWVDATQIAVKYGLGTRTHPMINTAMIGAFAGLLGKPPLEDVISAIAEEISVKTEQNIRAAKEAHETVCVHGKVLDSDEN
jgi:2-oxoacid:acceptor oxidoreductase gamma subunit (pyruvate/2-ketoisovalerate family)